MRQPLQHRLLWLRCGLIGAVAALLWAESGWLLAFAVAAAALVSNRVLAALPQRFSGSPWLAPAVLCTDTVWISAALLASGRFGADFFFLYFFVILLAGLGEHRVMIGAAAAAASAAYLYVLPALGPPWTLFGSPSLLRIPFLLMAVAFSSHLVTRTRIARRRAEEADRIKSEFLGTLSHELRTPLAVILGYVDLLLEDEFGTMAVEQRSVLRKVQKAGENLHRYLSRLLDVSRLVSRLQSGREALVCSEFSLGQPLSELRHAFPDVDGARVVWPAVADTPPLYTDREKLVTILRNLVENAIKYGRGAPITVNTRWEGPTDTVVFTVSDRGIGISAEDLGHVFDPFRRTVKAMETDAQGAGLGLYIVKQFAELLHGTIEAESTAGVGSTFTLRIPRQLRPASARAAA